MGCTPSAYPLRWIKARFPARRSVGSMGPDKRSQS